MLLDKGLSYGAQRVERQTVFSQFLTGNWPVSFHVLAFCCFFSFSVLSSEQPSLIILGSKKEQQAVLSVRAALWRKLATKGRDRITWKCVIRQRNRGLISRWIIGREQIWGRHESYKYLQGLLLIKKLLEVGRDKNKSSYGRISFIQEEDQLGLWAPKEEMNK